MKNFLFAICILLSASTYAQDGGSIKGTIVDRQLNDEPLLFAQVQLKGSAISTQTNLHGNFELDGISAGSHVLVISYPGYEHLEVPFVVEGRQMVTIRQGLRAKSISLQQPVEDRTAEISGNGLPLAADNSGL